jgi:hypothetical protein
MNVIGKASFLDRRLHSQAQFSAERTNILARFPGIMSARRQINRVASGSALPFLPELDK